MRIIRVVPDILPEDKAYGYFVTFLKLSIEQEKLGHQVLIFCKGIQDSIGKINDMPLYRLETPKHFPFLALQIRLKNILEKYIDDSASTIIHSHDRNALLISYLTKRPPHIVHLHGLPFPLIEKYRKQNPLSFKGYLYNLRVHYMYKLFLKKADAIISYSKDLALLLKQYNIPNNLVHIIANGVDENFLGYFDPLYKTEIQNALKLNPEDKVILFVGRIKWIKGIYHLLYAMTYIIKKHKTAKLLIIGNVDNSSEKINEYISNLGIGNHVIWLKHIPYNLLPYYYSLSQVHVAVSFAPGYPKTLLESLACGTPVIAIKNVDTLDILDKHNCGLVVNEGTIKEIVSKVDFLLTNQDIAMSMGKRGHTLIQNEYTWKKCAEKINAVYDIF